MYKIGISSCRKTIGKELFEEFSKNGISYIELSEEGYDGFDFEKAASLSEEYGVGLWSLHLPFAPFETIDISSLNKEKRESTIKMLSELIKKGADVGIDKFIIHPSAEPIEDAERGERMKYSRESLSRLADVSESLGGVICAEDLPRSCIGHSIEEMKFLTAEDERIKVCFDTNHITVEKPEEIITALGDKIVTLHVSDYDFVNERHWLPGEGKIDWKKLMAALEEINYGGAFMYEIGYACPKTILRSRDLNVADFKRNAEELFTGSDLTVFSTPKPNLGMWE